MVKYRTVKVREDVYEILTKIAEKEDASLQWVVRELILQKARELGIIDGNGKLTNVDSTGGDE